MSNQSGSTSNSQVKALSFNGVELKPVMRDGQIWMTAAELANALGYADASAVTRIYSRNHDEFTDAMTLTVKLTVKGFGNGNSEKDTRIFSLRGCHLIAMLARTNIAKEFRVWVLDILDKEVSAPVVAPMSSYDRPIKDYTDGDIQRLKDRTTLPELADLLRTNEAGAAKRLCYSFPENQAQQLALPNLQPQIQEALKHFWDTVSQLDLHQINHSCHPDVLAISLPELYRKVGEQLPQRRSMLTALKHSLIPQFKDSNHAINSIITGNTKKCWVFIMQNEQEEA